MILLGVQNLRQLFLLDTNIKPIQNNKMQAGSSFTFSKQPTIISQHKLALTAINKLFALKSLEPLKNSKASRVP
jgi:hypothetical protein